MLDGLREARRELCRQLKSREEIPGLLRLVRKVSFEEVVGMRTARRSPTEM